MVRGAVQQLATEGLVEIRPRSGTFVANLTSQEVEETFRIRCAMKGLAAGDGLANIYAATDPPIEGTAALATTQAGDAARTSAYALFQI